MQTVGQCVTARSRNIAEKAAFPITRTSHLPAFQDLCYTFPTDFFVQITCDVFSLQSLVTIGY